MKSERYNMTANQFPIAKRWMMVIGLSFIICHLSFSEAHFVSKLNIALKEASETSYWLVVLHKANFLEEKLFNSLKEDIDEIIRLLIASIKTTKKNMA